MSTTVVETPLGTTVPAAGAWATLRRGLRLTPELTAGLRLTLTLAGLATLGRLAVPFAVQQTVDRGLNGPGGPRPGLVLAFVAAAGVVVVLTAVLSFAANRRLFRASEAGLASLRVKAFRHVHDLSVLTQGEERRGSLVSRVTSDVDTISNFVQFGGLTLLVSLGQIVVATGLMAWYSWSLTLLVWACFLPVLLAAPRLQRVVSRAYTAVRARVGDMLGAISEAVVGAETIRAYAVQDRVQSRVDAAVDAHRGAAVRAQILVAVTFTGGVLVSGLVVAAVVVVGLLTGVRPGGLTLGELLAMLFLVQLFTGPVQVGTEVLNELQNALAGWRRVMVVLDTPADVADPLDGVALPPGPVGVRFEGVSFAYPGGPPVLRDVTLDLPAGARVAVVGETGSGKSTLAKLLTRLMDPASGRVLLNGTDLRRVRFASLRERVVLVPQEGYLLDASFLENVRFARPDADRARVEAVLEDLGLREWAHALPRGLDSPVGQRGESLSAGERQLVSLVRAALADPDLLVLDEATSAVDPATEVRLQRALDSATRGRTSVTIAHRLSTAEAADLVVVVDAGEVVDHGTHQELLTRSDVYQRLHAAWAGQRRAA